MILLPDAKRKINDANLSSVAKAALIDVLDQNITLHPPKLEKSIVLFIEKTLSELGYLAIDQANGIWGNNTTEALKQGCLAHNIRYSPDTGIGQTTLLAILTPVNNGINLSAPYYSQRDSQTGHAWRMCFSSSCAMLLKHIKSSALHGANADDDYLNRLFSLNPNADTVNASDQLRTLLSFGVKATFRQDLTELNIIEQLKKNKPVPVGILHQGNLATTGPTGGGHWLLIKGVTPDGLGWIVNDPFGELDLIGGTYVSVNGKDLVYSKKNFNPRWRVNGSGGWGIIV